jgi:carbonic anhydrase
LNTTEAWARICNGLKTFRTDVFPEKRAMFERLRRNQQPLALFITCADSRILPNLITQTDPGEIFTERNPGNMVPTYSEYIGGVTAGVEYANLVLRVPLIVICGHTDCGVMKALLHPETTAGMPGVQQWMRYGNDACWRVLRDQPDLSEEEKVNRLAEANVIEQIAHLKTHPSVAQRLAASEVEVRGWVYDIGSGSIWQAHPETGRFELLTC